MAKVCVFCGQPPQKKNKEHVIPHWLIKLTGDPDRQAVFGFDFLEMRQRSYAFDQFQFPACKDCNEEFSDLETVAERIINDILAMAAPSAWDFTVLLDWFDKVRVGLWLGLNQLYMHKVVQIEPKFHIKSRIGANDRALIIYRVSDAPVGINFIGVDTLAFQLIPSCFGFRVNDFYFLSLSKEFLLSEQLGFPYPRLWVVKDDKTLNSTVTLRRGSGVISSKVLPRPIPSNGVEIYQPKIRHDLSSLYDTDFIRHRSIDYEHDVGPIIFSYDGHIDGLPRSVNIGLTGLGHAGEFRSFTTALGLTVFDHQVWTLKHTRRLLESSGLADPDVYRKAIHINRLFMKLMRDGKLSAMPHVLRE